MAGALQGRTAVVTGGSKGIGYAIAEALAKADANVLITSRHEDEVRAAAEKLDFCGSGKVAGIAADQREHADVQRVMAAAADQLGGVDILINNAGVGIFGPIDQMSVEDWSTVLDTNLTGVFYCCREAVPLMKKRGGGWIINIGSLAGKNPFAGGAAYNASKFGLLGFSEAMMLDLRDQDIRVSCIMPGSVETHFNGNQPSDQGAWKIQPEDIAAIVMDLLAMNPRTLPSRIEVRPSKPRKG
ncbi:SDR family oxidoreductase [Longimicrobium terrae]|uniref:NAD(P)-dependent dehydrogenase (Short-subunit alcohol dehydrogenase family) n=1 Tax=Longimicrobium terrae TaxID=1639882 RepID=A0A841GYY0_9BACT|nr:SDR family oxidoreductase [Longimicrobium terrae]MBB4636519.1 NAD(P)-dependent dehydrogenase (short-subunit alcohol dehydrogenase family) [Longimicrobium terrae]MBB6070957.1 NAD(P)-dependent dehydrogenase (short-subunit alcohol dehydrogenase family) [Longimicrobium terrae]NNC28979.1 SDR family oxidoreductase [Longimicrobium terrae]